MDKTNNKPRGYAFIEFVHTRDMKGFSKLLFFCLFGSLTSISNSFGYNSAAYKQADGKKIDNRRVLVDVERGRTVPNWRPRRLGGGLGTTRVGNEDANRYCMNLSYVHMHSAKKDIDLSSSLVQ